MDNKIMKNKKAQLSMFIILALIIVVLIAIAFIIYNNSGLKIKPSEDPKAYIEKCTSDSLEEVENLIVKNNFYLNLSGNFVFFNGTKVPYLCRSSLFYGPCVNQEPMLIENVRKDIENYTTKDIEKCLTILIKDLKNKGYLVSEGNLKLNVEFKDNFIIANIDKKIVLKKAEETKIYENFISQVPSPLFELMKTSQKIVDYESTYCEFNDINWMLNYPKTSITNFVTGDKTKVYTLTDKVTNKKINFAVKACVLPAGI
jgi:hypothetical protein